MKLNPLTAIFSALPGTLIRAAPSPQPLEIVLSVNGANQIAHQRAMIPQTAEAIFHGADPESFYSSSVPVNGQSFKIDNDLSVSYITLQGFVGCVFGGIDGSLTYLKSYGIPQTVPVGPPQVQVNGTCKDPNIDLSVS